MVTKMSLPKLTDAVSMNKLKFVRGYSYISAFMIPFLVAREMSTIIPSINWWILFIFVIVIVWVIGHIDWKYFWKNELKYSFLKNPEWIEKMKVVQNDTKTG